LRGGPAQRIHLGVAGGGGHGLHGRAGAWVDADDVCHGRLHVLSLTWHSGAAYIGQALSIDDSSQGSRCREHRHRHTPQADSPSRTSGDAAMTPTLPIPVVLAGVHGHGRSHLRTLQRLSEQGIVRLVGVCDPRPVPPSLLAGFGSVTYSPDLSDVLRTTGAAITILVTPIHTHLPLARTALEHGSHLLVEKPPTATLAEFEELCTAVALSGLACQVGFQSLGSSAVAAVRSLIAD